MQWQNIRKVIVDESGGACHVCGASQDKGMIVDEVWTYEPGVATLADLRLLCPPCNNVTHVATARRVAQDTVVDHCAKINGISEGAAAAVIAGAFATWDSLHNASQWTILVAPRVADRFPALAALDGTTA